MDIKRDKYLNDLINRMHNGMIKVITGIRRCGKSYLIFDIFKKYLVEQGVNEQHIISIELDKRKDKKYRDPDAILDYIESCVVDEDTYYILLDEVQLLEDFEEKTTESDIETIYNKSVSLFNKIKDERNDELHAKDAKELSNGNLIFKSLRRNGYIEKLINLRNNSYDKYNSLD